MAFALENSAEDRRPPLEMTIASFATKTEKKFLFLVMISRALNGNYFDHLFVCLDAQQTKDSPIVMRMIPRLMLTIQC